MGHDRKIEREHEEYIAPLDARAEKLDEGTESAIHESRQKERFGRLDACVEQALTRGQVDRDLLATLASDDRAIIEALVTARLGAKNSEKRVDHHNVSGLARMHLLNNALANLQPVFAAAHHERSLTERMQHLAELVEETRSDIKQRVLLDTAKGGVGDRKRDEEEESEEGEGDEEPPEDDEGKREPASRINALTGEPEIEPREAKEPRGFGALLAGARRRLSRKTKSPSDAAEPTNKQPKSKKPKKAKKSKSPQASKKKGTRND